MFDAIKRIFGQGNDRDDEDDFMMYEDRDPLHPDVDDPWGGSRAP